MKMQKKRENLKRILFLFLISILFLSLIDPLIAIESGEKKVNQIHFFEQRGCPDCARQKEFLENIIKSEYPDVKINFYSIMNSENQEKFHQMMQERGVEDYKLMVPTTFIGENYFENFYESDKELIKRAIEGEDVKEEIAKIRGESIIKIPFYGEINISEGSIIFLAFVIGSLDGLNVCSIGALILILTLVLTSFHSRTKMIFYGGLFILTSVIIYGVLVFSWTALFEFLANYIGGINLIIGFAALLGGVYFFKKFIDFYRYGPACDYSDNRYIIRSTKKLKESFGSKDKTILLTISVIIFAAVVTLIELPCSFGLPLIYGGILVSKQLSMWGYLFYVGLYLFFYMLIELIIFAGAIVTKEVWFAESKYITWIYLMGSIVLIFLSYYYLIGF